jgi:hypothetical protein
MNVTTRGRGRPCTHGGPSQSGRGHGCSHNSGRGAPAGNRGSYNNTNAQRASGSPSDGGQSHPHCQVCFKIGHTAANCWYRYDEVYVPNSRMAGMASASTTDSNWYLDLGATDHITIELEKLTMHETYHGNDKIRAANGAGMDITHVGKAILSAPSRTLRLNNVLHVPNSHKQLDSVGTLNTGYPRVQAPCQDERQDGPTQRRPAARSQWLATMRSGSTTLGRQHSQTGSYNATAAQRQRYGPLIRHRYSAQ